MVNTADLKSAACHGLAGSSPAGGTTLTTTKPKNSMKAIRGLIAAIEGGLKLTLYRNSFESIAEYVAELQTGSTGAAPNKKDFARLLNVLATTSERFDREKFLTRVSEHISRHNSNP